MKAAELVKPKEPEAAAVPGLATANATLGTAFGAAAGALIGALFGTGILVTPILGGAVGWALSRSLDHGTK